MVKVVKRMFGITFSLFILSFVVLTPFVWLVLQSFQPYENLATSPPHFIPESLVNYERIFNPGDLAGAYAAATPSGVRHFPRSILNSFIVSVFVVAFTLPLASLSSYTFARMRFRGRDKLLIGTLGLRMIPTASLILPIYVVMNTLYLVDNVLSLIITETVMLLPYNIWILTTFFESIPMELDDAAKLDGCNRLQTLFKIILPCAKPGLIAVIVMNFLVSWNEFFIALILTRSEATYTLPVVIAMFTAVPQMLPYDFMVTAGVIGALPPIIIALISHKYIVKGLLLGSPK